MPSVSGAQHRAMEAAAHGHSTLGIPKSVGKEFSEADKGKHFSSKVDAILKRIDEFKIDQVLRRLDDAGWNESDHPRDADGKFATSGGAAAHGIASYKKTLGYKKATGSGLMQHMIMSGHYSEADILQAWNLATGGTTKSAVKGQINLLKKAGHNVPTLPAVSAVPWKKTPEPAVSTAPASKPTDQDKLASKVNPDTKIIIDQYAKDGHWDIIANTAKNSNIPATKAYAQKLMDEKVTSEINPVTKGVLDQYSELGNWKQLENIVKNHDDPNVKAYAQKLLDNKGAATPPPPAPKAEPAAKKEPGAKPFESKVNGDAVSTEVENLLKPVYQHWDSLTGENKPKVEAKLKELDAAFDVGDDIDKFKTEMGKIKPIDGIGKSVTAVNQAIDKIKAAYDIKPAPDASKPAHSNALVKAPHSPRAQRMEKAFHGAAQAHGTHDPVAVEVCPTLKPDFWNSVPAKAKSAAHAYTGSAYTTMNKALRDWNTETVNKHTIEQINAIDDLFEDERAALTKDVILRRGETLPNKIIDKWKKALASGVPCRYQKDGYVSTSIASKAAFGGNVIYEIVARKGTPALGVDTVSSHNENEVILRHGQAFEIFEIEDKGGQHVVRMATI